MPDIIASRVEFADAVIHTWGPLTSIDGQGTPISYIGSGDKSVQISGTFGAGGTCVIEGSNDGIYYYTLTDAQTTAISKTAAGLEQVVESTLWIRPRMTVADGTTSITVTLYVRTK